MNRFVVHNAVAARTVRWLLVTFLAAMTAFGGCSGNDLGANVSGVVTLDGTAIGPGVVIFAPVGGKENPAVGAIQPDGSYYLKTSQDRGLRPGNYEVAVQINEIPTDLVPGQRDTRKLKSRIPQKYTAVKTSGLAYDIEPGSSTINIELSSQ